MASNRRGRPRKYAAYEEMFAGLPKPMTKRPQYENGVGVFRGSKGDTAWVKIRLPLGGSFRGKIHRPGSAIEIKLGRLASWSWEQLEAERDKLQSRADRGEPLEDVVSPTFEAWASDWLERAVSRVKAVDTATIHVNKHLVPAFAGKLLSAITVNDVDRWIAEQRKELAPGTVKRQFNTLRAILNDAMKSGHIEANPCRHADPIRGVVARQRFLDGDELVALLAVAEQVANWLPDFILWCVHSGMRKGEVKALLWSDILMFENGRTFAQVRNSKNDQPRIVSCTETMNEILDRQRGRQAEGDDRVFPIADMTLRRKWERARKLAGLEDVTVHDLRRTHSTYAAASGVDLRTLAGRIGHTDLTMLQKHYAALVGSADAEAANIIGRVLDTMTAKQR
jgi:integrase